MLTLKNKISKSDVSIISDMVYDDFKEILNWENKYLAKMSLRAILSEIYTGKIVAYDNNLPVGLITYTFKYPICDIHDKTFASYGLTIDDDSYLVSMIFVSEKYRNHGIGKKLVGKFEDEVKKQGATQLHANCLNGYKGASYNLFKKMGYITLKHLPNYFLKNKDGIIVYKNIIK